jgi:hypothetical protein
MKKQIIGYCMISHNKWITQSEEIKKIELSDKNNRNYVSIQTCRWICCLGCPKLSVSMIDDMIVHIPQRRKLTKPLRFNTLN